MLLLEGIAKLLVVCEVCGLCSVIPIWLWCIVFCLLCTLLLLLLRAIFDEH